MDGRIHSLEVRVGGLRLAIVQVWWVYVEKKRPGHSRKTDQADKEAQPRRLRRGSRWDRRKTGKHVRQEAGVWEIMEWTAVHAAERPRKWPLGNVATFQAVVTLIKAISLLWCGMGKLHGELSMSRGFSVMTFVFLQGSPHSGIPLHLRNSLTPVLCLSFIVYTSFPPPLKASVSQNSRASLPPRANLSPWVSEAHLFLQGWKK